MLTTSSFLVTGTADLSVAFSGSLVHTNSSVIEALHTSIFYVNMVASYTTFYHYFIHFLHVLTRVIAAKDLVALNT